MRERDRRQRKTASKIVGGMVAEQARTAREVIRDEAAQFFLAQVAQVNANGTVNVRRPEETNMRGAPSPVIGVATPAVGDWVWCVDLGPAGVLAIQAAHTAQTPQPIRPAGGTITGNLTVNQVLSVLGNTSIGGTLTLSADPVGTLEAATKRYVDAADAATVVSNPASPTIWAEPVRIELRKGRNGFVNLTGRVRNSRTVVNPSGSRIITIPASFLPAAASMWACARFPAGSSSASESSVMPVFIDMALGQLKIGADMNADQTLDLSNINWWCAP